MWCGTCSKTWDPESPNSARRPALSIVTLNEVEGLGRRGVNARPQTLRPPQADWRSMTSAE